MESGENSESAGPPTAEPESVAESNAPAEESAPVSDAPSEPAPMDVDGAEDADGEAADGAEDEAEADGGGGEENGDGGESGGVASGTGASDASGEENSDDDGRPVRRKGQRERKQAKRAPGTVPLPVRRRRSKAGSQEPPPKRSRGSDGEDEDGSHADGAEDDEGKSGADSEGASGRDDGEDGDHDNEDGDKSGEDAPAERTYRPRGRGRGRGGARGGRRRGRPPKNRPPMRSAEGSDVEVEEESEGSEASEHDPRGEEKIDKDGNLLGGREFKFRVFKLPRHPSRLFMFTIDAARSLGYRDSFLFYAKNKELPKLLAREEDKDHLVELGFLIPQLKTRNINLIPARQLFKKFGHRCIKRGIPVRDDYFVGDKPEPDENEYWESWGQEQEEEEEGEQPLGERGTVPSWRNALRKTEGIVKDLIDGNQAGLGGAQLEKEADQIPQAARNRMARMVVAGSESNDRITQERLQRSVHQFEVNTRQPVFPTVYTANVHVRWEMERGSNVDPGRKINIEVVPVEQDDDPRWMPLEPTEESIKYPLAVDAGQYQANFSIFTHRFGREHEPVVMPSTLGFIPKSIGGPGPQMQPYQQPPGPYGPPYPGMQMQPTPGGPMTPAMIAAQQRNAQPHYSFFCGFKTNHGMPCKRPVTRNGERCLYHRSEQGGVAPSLGPSPRPPLPGGVKPEGTPAAPSPVPPPVAESSFPPVKRGPGRPPKHPKPNPVCEECETESTPARLEKDTSQDPMPNLMLRCAIDKLHFHAYCAEVGTPPMIAKVVTYPWECSECKLCCVCKEAGDDENLLLCDACDRGYHLGCLVPKPDSLPEGSWLCPLCAVCHTCGRKSEQKPAKGELAEMLAARTQRTPQADVEAANVASEFQHAVVPTPAHLVPRNGSNTYTATYCSGCFPDWEGDRFCPVCLVTYAADQDDVKMVQCDKCDRWVHTQCDPGMDDVRYKKLMDAGDSAKYTCPCCSPGDAWRLTKVAREGKRPIEYKGFVILA